MSRKAGQEMTIAQPPARLGQLTAGVNETFLPGDTRERVFKKVSQQHGKGGAKAADGVHTGTCKRRLPRDTSL